jgi:hypothetical protein
MNTWTKERQAEYHKQYREDNKEHLYDYHKQWEIDNKDHVDAYREANREKILKQQQDRHAKNPEKRAQDWDKWYAKNKVRSPQRRFTEAKHSAKRRDIDWSLTLEEYTALIEMPCYYCENQLYEPVRRATGLDRLDSNKDYEISNVVSCCYLCNTMKNAFLTPEETKSVANFLIELRKKKG